MSGEFYKMDFRAWNFGTVDLTLEQEAAYLRLCHAMYDVGGPVPNSTRFLQGIFRCGNTKAVALVAQLIQAGKIVVTANGSLFNHRVSEELANRERVSSARRAAGERGGTASGAIRAKPLKDMVASEAIGSTPRSRGEERRGEKIEIPEDPKGSSAPKGPAIKSTRIPDDFEHWPEALATVQAEGYSGEEAADVIGEFVDYWRPLPKGAKAMKTDWIATLRNRLRDLRHRKPRPASRASPQASSPQQRALDRARQAHLDLTEDRNDQDPSDAGASGHLGAGRYPNGYAGQSLHEPLGGRPRLAPPLPTFPPRAH